MKRKTLTALFLSTFFISLVFISLNYNDNPNKSLVFKKIKSTSSSKAKATSKEGRDEYFFNLMKSPRTNSLPDNYRSNELKFAKNLEASSLKKANTNFTWVEAGPNDVGGRTRALAIDVRNDNVVFAGGISGGIWKSTDKGTTWEIKNTTEQMLAVTSIIQDPRPGHQDTWYYSSGEYHGNSASDQGATARFYGIGIFKSTDNGESWVLIPGSGNPNRWDNVFDYVTKIQVNPATGTVFFSSNALGLMKSTDGFGSITSAFESGSRFIEFDISENGTIVLSLSEAATGSREAHAGIWVSKDDGNSWDEIIPDNYPSGTDYSRGVVAIAPSNQNVSYVLLEVSDADHDHRFYKLNLTDGSYEDRSANLPTTESFGGEDVYPDTDNNAFISQGSYDLMVAVHPDDENLILIGGINLLRSFDGFATPLTESYNEWIGGYDSKTGNGPYPNSHADVHSFAFENSNPNAVWIGTDGGLSYTTDITSSVSEGNYFAWENKNNAYNVTQIYYVSIPDEAGDNRIMSGSQDNGTPMFRFDGLTIGSSVDVSSGDGGNSYFGNTLAYCSVQFGGIVQVSYHPVTNDVISIFYAQVEPEHAAVIHPIDAEGQLFINPFAVDPSDENVMYYPSGFQLFRHTALNTIEYGTGSWDGNEDEGWEVIGEDLSEHNYTAIATSVDNSSNVVYLGASSYEVAPIIKKITNAASDDFEMTELAFPASVVAGTYLHDIAVNPKNSDEIMVVFSNYDIESIFYSNDGGLTFTSVEGNLGGEIGPSVRCAQILPSENGTVYFVGTSIGLFSTNSLTTNTTWTKEGADVIGNVVVASIASRTSDNTVVVGTHGRGVFRGTSNTTAVEQISAGIEDYHLSQNYPNPFNPTTKIRYSIPTAGKVNLTVYDINGKKIQELINTVQSSGTYQVDWNGRNSNGARVASGIYFYTITAGKFVQTKKMTLLK